jgi:hypothetical protein
MIVPNVPSIVEKDEPYIPLGGGGPFVYGEGSDEIIDDFLGKSNENDTSGNGECDPGV